MNRPILLSLLILPVLPIVVSDDIASEVRQKVDATTQVLPPVVHSGAKTEVLQAASELLNNTVNFRNDGVAVTNYRRGEIRSVLEFRDLTVRQIIHGSVSPTDLERGITRRLYAQLGYSSYRSCSPGKSPWSGWQTTFCSYFPSHIVIEEIDGELRTSAERITHFTPGATTPANALSVAQMDARLIARN